MGLCEISLAQFQGFSCLLRPLCSVSHLFSGWVPSFCLPTCQTGILVRVGQARPSPVGPSQATCCAGHHPDGPPGLCLVPPFPTPHPGLMVTPQSPRKLYPADPMLLSESCHASFSCTPLPQHDPCWPAWRLSPRWAGVGGTLPNIHDRSSWKK